MAISIVPFGLFDELLDETQKYAAEDSNNSHL